MNINTNADAGEKAYEYLTDFHTIRLPHFSELDHKIFAFIMKWAPINSMLCLAYNRQTAIGEECVREQKIQTTNQPRQS